jgi:trigger factor
VKIDKKALGQHELEITVRVERADAQPWLDKAAAHLSEHRPIKGFRPGKAPYDIVKREFGEAAILEAALEDIINGTFNSVLDNENIRTYGKINFDLLPILTADEVAAYKATMTLLPTMTLGDWKSKKIKRQAVAVSDEEIEKATDELAAMTTTESPTDKPATTGDKVVVDFEVQVDGKVIDGGTAKDFGLVLGEGRMIPGFEDKIVGAKAGDQLEFKLNFPDKYQAAHLAGKAADFKVSVNQVLNRIKPAVDDAFAQRVGVANLAELKTRLKANLELEKQDKERERAEIAAIKQVVDSSTFGDFPQIIIDDTADELIHDFEHSLAHQGVKMDQYLASVGKTMEQVKKEFEPKAVERVKSSMALGQIAETENLQITAKEIEEEMEAQRRAYANNQPALNDMDRPEYRRHIANSLINRKIVQFIADQIIE